MRPTLFFVLERDFVRPTLLFGTTRLNFASQSAPFGLLCNMSVVALLVVGAAFMFVDGIVVFGQFAVVGGFVVVVVVVVDDGGVIEPVLLVSEVEDDVSGVVGEVVDGVDVVFVDDVEVADGKQLVVAGVVVVVVGCVVVLFVGFDGVVCAFTGAASAPIKATAAANPNSLFMPRAPLTSRI